KNRRRGIFPQPKVWKTGEYLVYFLFSKLRGWGKSPAIRPQTQLCGVALTEIRNNRTFRAANSRPYGSAVKCLQKHNIAE
ncbi:MAG: hypothetical protein SPE19_07660, partial [Candidatus Faecousia sp.]|nr:hypothetical protein [Candidatus Faecousia sp.]